MAILRTHIAVAAAALLVGSCTFANDALFPSLTPNDLGSQTGTAESGQSSVPPPVAVAESQGIDSATLSALKVSAGPETDTFVGQKVSALRSDLSRLQSTLAAQNGQLQQIRARTTQDTARYNGTVAAINTRLQLGTTPGNPILTRQWNEAQGELNQVSDDVLQLSRLSSDVASTSGMAAYLLDSVRAARALPGAVDEDHRQLRALEDDTNATTVLIERLLGEIAGDIQRQQYYVNYERANLNALAVGIKNGQFYGRSLNDSRLPVDSQPIAGGPAPGEKPLVIIRFDRHNVAYEDALYTAVRSALDRRPNAVFDVVAMAPTSGTPGSVAIGGTNARRNADSVVRSLTQMGLPQDRIRQSAAQNAQASSGEVQVFVR